MKETFFILINWSKLQNSNLKKFFSHRYVSELKNCITYKNIIWTFNLVKLCDIKPSIFKSLYIDRNTACMPAAKINQSKRKKLRERQTVNILEDKENAK